MSVRYTQGMTAGNALQDGRPALSRRHLDVLALIAQGYSNEEIAKRLFIGAYTVKQHVADIHARLNARSRAHCVHLAHKYAVPAVLEAPTHAPDVTRRTRVKEITGLTERSRR